VLRAEKDALQVHVDHVIPFLFRGVDVRLVVLDAGVVHEHVEAAERLLGGLDHSANVRVPLHVRPDELGIAARVTDRRDDVAAEIFLDIGDEDSRAFARE
jgi:hypothetical protein